MHRHVQKSNQFGLASLLAVSSRHMQGGLFKTMIGCERLLSYIRATRCKTMKKDYVHVNCLQGTAGSQGSASYKPR